MAQALTIRHRSRFIAILFFLIAVGLPDQSSAQDQNPTPNSPVQPGAGATTTEPTPAPLPPPQRTQWVAHLMRVRSEDRRISGLGFYSNQFPIVLVPKGSDLRPTISIEGRFANPGWTLAVRSIQDGAGFDTPIELNAQTGSFSIPLHLRGRVNELLLVAKKTGASKDQKSNLQAERVYIYAPEAMEFHVVSPWDNILISIGPSFLSYTQTGYGEYQSISAMLSGRYSTPEAASRWGFLANLNASLITITSSPIERGPQLIEAKLDGSYALREKADKKYRIQLLGGLNYLTLLSNGSPFGFSDLVSPEIGVRVRRIFNPVVSMVGEVRWAVMAMPPDISQRGIDASLAWSRFQGDSKRLEAGIGVFSYVFQPDTSQLIQATQITIRLGLSI